MAPEEQAEPLETAKPSRSKEISRLSVFNPLNPRFKVLGRLSSGSAKRKNWSRVWRFAYFYMQNKKTQKFSESAFVSYLAEF